MMEIKITIEAGKSLETLIQGLVKVISPDHITTDPIIIKTDNVNDVNQVKLEKPKKTKETELKKGEANNLVDFNFLRNEIKALAANKQDEGFGVRPIIKKYAPKIKDVADGDLAKLKADLEALK